jgi:WD40 repeat protein
MPTHTWNLQEGLIHGLAVLPGGGLFVSSAENGGVVVASLADGRVLHTLEGHEGPVNSLCLTPDGARLITGGDDHTVRVWGTRDWQVQHVLHGHEGYVREVAASDTVIVSGSEDDTVRFWDPASGSELHVGQAHREHLRTVAVTRDGRRAASSGLDNQVVLWDTERGDVERTLYDASASVVRVPDFGNLYIATGNNSGHGHHDAPRRLLFLDGGRTLASIEKEVIFWDLATGEERQRWPRGGWGNEDVALHPDGRLLALGGHGYVQVWDLAAGELVTTLGRGGIAVSALAFSPDGRWLLAGSDRGVVQVWDFDAGLRAEDGCPHQHSVNSLVTHGARALTGDTGGGVALWDLAVPWLLRHLDVEREANGRPMALGEDAALTAESAGFAVWDATTGELRRRVSCEGTVPSPTPHALASLSDGRVLVGFLGEGLALFGPGEGEAQRLAGATQQISILAVSPDERYAVSSGYFERAEDRARADRESSGKYVYVPSVSHLQGWDLEARALLWTVAAGGGEDYVDFVFCLFTPDGRLVTRSGEDERELAFWDPRTGAVVQTVELPGNYPTETRLAGRELVTLVFDEAGKTDEGWPCTAVRIDLATGTVAYRRALGRLPMNAAFSPDGWRLATAGPGALDVYDVATGDRVAHHACGAKVRELSFTDDGRRVVLGDEAGRVHILALDGWEPTQAQPWTPEELEALRDETAAREPVRPAPQSAKRAAPKKKSKSKKSKKSKKKPAE